MGKYEQLLTKKVELAEVIHSTFWRESSAHLIRKSTNRSIRAIWDPDSGIVCGPFLVHRLNDLPNKRVTQTAVYYLTFNFHVPTHMGHHFIIS